MTSRNFKIVYLPENSSKIKEFNFSRIKLFLLASLSLFIVLLITMYTVEIMTNGLYNSKLKRLQKDKMVLRNQLNYLENKMTSLKSDIETIIKRDDEMRVVANLPKFDEDVRALGVGGSVTRKPILSPFYSEETDISFELLEDMKKLERQIEFAQESSNEIMVKLETNEEMTHYLPSIRPVKGGRVTDRFGRRIHPITKRHEMHKAIDISVALGTPIIATADGTVEFAGKNMSYGNYVRIDHQSRKYGYKTAYAHLNKIRVKRGEKVKRGDIIGWVGRTGVSTAPHLHYEVWDKGKAVDPLAYYLDQTMLK